MQKAIFGTDGIRGQFGAGVITKPMMKKIALSAGRFMRNRNAKSIVIGRDTRESGPIIEAALCEGFLEAGIDVIKLGVLPTPGVASSIRSFGADFGVMITASHNPFSDNGIKFFNERGEKISDEEEKYIEDGLYFENISDFSGNESVGDNAAKLYVETLLSGLSSDALSGLRVVLDCANGAAFETAPRIFRALGVKELIVIGDSPDGRNINAGFGSTNTNRLSTEVANCCADIGVALDGDADRVIIVDENARTVDGDQLLGFLAHNAYKAGLLTGGGIVATVMSNIGLERFLVGLGLKLERTGVGDKHVAAKMREGGFNIGGEQSGHLLLSDFAYSGDGTLAAAHILMAVAKGKRPASEALNVFEPTPQKLVNVRYTGESPLNNQSFLDFITITRKDIEGIGRVLVRESGTEPLIRILVEGLDVELVENLSRRICDFLYSNVKS